MIKTLYNLLTSNELDWLLSKCENFVKNNETEPDGKIWFYNSMFLDVQEELIEFKQKIKEVVGPNYEIQYNGVFINKVIKETNLDDDYHIDSSDLTIVTYINENYIGGQFEYKENDCTLQIQPSINKSILMDRQILHRVLKVVDGERYSLIVWFKKVKKEII